ncbi:MAG: hypothetical protein AUH78_20000 [Gemmatimonadetes bacterium 13_1_40CM_4_69_8]|nr:MAG: hypothetical protein AUH78_20000 [Gemmatimonadetes bacterium 13_1_40CM_4_69_8]
MTLRSLLRAAAAGALAATFGATAAAAQDPRLGRLDPGTRPLVAVVIDSARAAGLPTEPLVQRALEGATKGAPGPLIVSAVQRLAADLGRAREALGPGTTPPELEAGAAALRAGAGPAVLAQLRRARRQTIAVPLAVLTDLVAGGVPVDSAAAAVLALAARARDADLVEFRRSVERDIALGAPPTAATAAAAAAADARISQVNAGARENRPGRP